MRQIKLSDFPELQQAKIPSKLPTVNQLLKRQRTIVDKCGDMGSWRRDINYNQYKQASKRILSQNDLMMLTGLQELAKDGASFRMEGATLVAELGTFTGRCLLDPGRPEYVKRAKEIAGIKK